VYITIKNRNLQYFINSGEIIEFGNKLVERNHK